MSLWSLEERKIEFPLSSPIFGVVCGVGVFLPPSIQSPSALGCVGLLMVPPGSVKPWNYFCCSKYGGSFKSSSPEDDMTERISL